MIKILSANRLNNRFCEKKYRIVKKMHTDRKKIFAYTVLDIHKLPNISIYIHVLSYKLKDLCL